MKIKEINIAAFGGLKNLKITPESGLNVFYGDNERGKSTIMAFIKMMFYGNGRNNADIAKNLRKKYTPWDGSEMAGSIDFEYGGRNYRLEREFRKSDATDKITVCDLDLGTRTSAEPDIGRRFFGLTAAGFERSVFIGQFGFPEGDPEGEIGKKLSNIALTGDESVSFETVTARLLKAKNALMSKSGTAGAYDKNIKAIEALKAELQKSAEAHETYGLVKEKLKRSKTEIIDMQGKAAELKQKISAEQDVRNAEKLKELLELKEKLDTLKQNATLSDGSVADEAYVKKLQFCINKADTSQSQLDSVKREIEILENSINDIEASSREEKEAKKAETEKSIQNTEQKRAEINDRLKSAREREGQLLSLLSTPDGFKKRVNPPLLGIGSVICVIGIIVAIVLSMAAGLGVAALGLLLLVLGFVVRPTDKNAVEKNQSEAKRIREEISQLELDANDALAELSVLKARLEAVNTALSGNAELLAGNKKRLLECKERLTSCSSEAENDKNVLHQLFARYKSDFADEDIKTCIEEISANASKQKEVKQQINYILKDVGNISYSEAAEKLKSISDKTDITADFDRIKAEYERLLSDISDKKSAMAEIAARAQQSLVGIRNPEDIKRQISELNATATAQKEYCDRLNIAMELMAESNIEVRRSYGSELEKKAAEILNCLTNGRYNSMSVSKNLEVAVSETDKFGTREIDYLSSGTADQAYLSLRLAISSLMNGNNDLLPVLMDDALAQYDDTRMKTDLQFLSEYAKECQIILFTCHKNICDEAEALGANVL